MRIEGARSAGAARGVGTISRGAPRIGGGSELSRAFSHSVSTTATRGRGPILNSYIAPGSERFQINTFAKAQNDFVRIQRSFPASIDTPKSSFEARTGRSLGLNSIKISNIHSESSPLPVTRIGETNKHGIYRKVSTRRHGVEHSAKPRSYDRAHRPRREYTIESQAFRPLSLPLPVNRRAETAAATDLAMPRIRHERFRPTPRGPLLPEPKRTFLPSRRIESDDVQEILRELIKKRERAQNINLAFHTKKPDRIDVDEIKPPAASIHTKKQPLLTKVISIRKAEQSPSAATQAEISTQKQPMLATARKKLTEVVAKLKVGLSTPTETSPQAKPAAKIDTQKKLEAKNQIVIFTQRKTDNDQRDSFEKVKPELDVNATDAREKLILKLREAVIIKFRHLARQPRWSDVAGLMPVHPDRKTISELVRHKQKDGSYSLVRNKLALSNDFYSTRVVGYLLHAIRAVRLRPKPKTKAMPDDVRIVQSDIPSLIGKHKFYQAA